MLFSRHQKAKIRNETLADLTSLAEWFGLTTDELDITGKSSMKEITIFICIKILSETLSKLPLKTYRDVDGIKKHEQHPILSLLKLRPNEYMSASDFWKTVETQLDVYGNSYVWIERISTGRQAGKVIGLFPLDASRIKIFVDNKGIISVRNKMWYQYTDDTGVEYKIESMDLLHFKGVTTNGLVGLNPIETLRKTIENAKSSSVFLNESYKNGMQTKGIIQYTGDLNSEAEETFKERFERMSNGLKNANKVSMLPIGYQFQPISMSMADNQFLENTNLTIRQLTAAYGIKLHQVNDLQKASYASTSEANKEFYTDTLLSKLIMYEQELTYKLMTTKDIERDGWYFKFNADAILRADLKTRYEAYRIAIQSGFKKINEVRAMEEDEPAPGGEVLLCNGTMIPVEMAGKQYDKGGDNK